MSLLEKLLEGNKRFQNTYKKYAEKLPSKPRRKLAILTCIDTRLNPIRIFHINIGDSVILRNAGNKVTDDVIRSLTIAIKTGVTEIIILGHTDCDYTHTQLIQTLKELEISQALPLYEEVMDLIESSSESNEETNLKHQVNLLRFNSAIPANIPIHGLLFNVTDGTLKVIVNGYKQRAQFKKPQKMGSDLPSIYMPSIYQKGILPSLKRLGISSTKNSDQE